MQLERVAHFQQSTLAPAIELSQVTKRYGSVTALSCVNLKVMPGEVYGILGPNGAGKSSMIKIIAGTAETTSGSVRVMGCDLSASRIEIKSRVGYVPETPVLYESLTPREFFEFVGSVRKIDATLANERVEKLASAFGLSQYYDSPIATLSMGTKQKVSIIAALLHKPPLLLLDEPLNSLDSKSGRIVKELVQIHTRKNGGAVLFSTHIMEIAESICDRIGIIYSGKIIAEGTLDELRREANAAKRNPPSENGRIATLEQVFLALTHEEDELSKTVANLRQTFEDKPAS